MEFLPKDIEDIIIDYKESIEKEEQRIKMNIIKTAHTTTYDDYDTATKAYDDYDTALTALTDTALLLLLLLFILLMLLLVM